MIDTDELMALLAKATPGEWQVNSSHIYGPDPERLLIAQARYPLGDPYDDPAAIVAAVNFCRTELPALIAERDALREALTLADAALRGANMNMHVVERKVGAALKGE